MARIGQVLRQNHPLANYLQQSFGASRSWEKKASDSVCLPNIQSLLQRKAVIFACSESSRLHTAAKIHLPPVLSGDAKQVFQFSPSSCLATKKQRGRTTLACHNVQSCCRGPAAARCSSVVSQHPAAWPRSKQPDELVHMGHCA